MSVMPPDCELVGAYVSEQSETAFRTLVSRHVDLVYGTAVRQVGDRSAAEEITQNVFITLARKAPRLAGVETLAGWLHRTTLFECKARIRSELRRRTREETAAALASLEREGQESLEALTPLVDEALLHLRETDRVALILRFFENQNLREVGLALGVDEDAARKRISRALERVMEFFRQRGFAVPAGTGIGVLLANSAQSAPAGLLAVAVNGGLAAGGSVSGISLLLFSLMKLSGTKLAVGCLLIAAAPLLWQSQVEARYNESLAAAQRELTAATRELDEIETRTRKINESISVLETGTQEAQGRLALLNAQRTGQAPLPTYQWDDDSPYMRVPKQLLAGLPTAVAQKGKTLEISETVKEFLQMTDDETRQVRAALQEFYNQYEAILMGKVRSVKPDKSDLNGHKPEEVRAFEVDDCTKEIKEMRQELFGVIRAVLGPERLELFQDSLSSWMPVAGYSGLSSDMIIIDYKHRRSFYKTFNTGPDHTPTISVTIDAPKHGSVTSSIEIDRIPQAMAAHLQDWIAEANAIEPKP